MPKSRRPTECGSFLCCRLVVVLGYFALPSFLTVVASSFHDRTEGCAAFTAVQAVYLFSSFFDFIIGFSSSWV